MGWGGVGMLTFFLVRTLDVATLQRSLWYPCYVTCCYAAEIPGILATLHEQGSKDAMKGFNYYPPSLLKICDLLCVAIGGLM